MIEEFLANDAVGVAEHVSTFMGGLGLRHQFGYKVQSNRPLPTGVPSRFLDLYPEGVVEKHDGFGGLFVRLWLVGRDPVRLIYGVFLGAQRAEQAEPRRVADYLRNRLSGSFGDLERKYGFFYKTWADRDVWWQQDGKSVRAVTRQLEQFMSMKIVEVNAADPVRLANDVTALVRFIDAAVDDLQPTRQFGTDVLMLYYGTNLPDEPEAVDLLPSVRTADAMPATVRLPVRPDLGHLRGLEEAYADAAAVLESGRNVLLQGPPGTGKTELAERMCLLAGKRAQVVTATSDWGPEQAVGGYLPLPENGAAREPLDFVHGVFTQAMQAGDWLVVDEINRGDMDRALGEMFTLLGGRSKTVLLNYRKRGDDGIYRRVVIGPEGTDDHDRHLIVLPSDWRFFATMNTFDKARLYEMSNALARRFGTVTIDLPEDEEYRTILDAGSGCLGGLRGDDQMRDDVLRRLTKLFVPAQGAGLDALDLRVGPAIPLDMMRWIAARERHGGDLDRLVLKSMSVHLFKQYEGQAKKLDGLVAAIREAVGIEALPTDIMRSLAGETTGRG